MRKVRKLLREYRPFLLFLFLLMFFRTGYADWSPVPSSSMEPTIYPGDVLWVDKTQYGPSLPFLNKRLFTWAQPERGDIITFVPPHEDSLYVKRVMAVAGDRIRIEGSAISINGQVLEQSLVELTDEAIIGVEQLDGIPHGIQLTRDRGLDWFGRTVVVPEGKLFVMGDHRNMSADSREWGFVDASRVMGKVSTVALSVSGKRDWSSRVAVSIH